MKLRGKRFYLGVILLVCAGLLAGCGVEREAEHASQLQADLSGQSVDPAAGEPELPPLERAQELESLTPADFGCMEEEYPTRHSTYTLLPGDELENTVHVLTGQEEGPLIYVVGGTHGDELAGWYAGTLLQGAAIKAGTVCLAAPLNRYGAEHDQRRTKDGWDLNRHFPGDAQGNDAQRIAEALYQDIEEKQPVLVLDLHEARLHTDGRDNLGNSIICQDIQPIADLVLALLEDSASGALDLSHSLDLYGSPPQGSLNAEVTQGLGIPVITVETLRAEALNVRVRNQLCLAEYIFLWYNMR